MINKFFRKIDFCYKLLKLNLFWIFFSTLGLFFWGVVPSTVSLANSLKKILNYEDVKFKDYYLVYKENFILSNRKLGLFLIGGLILYAEIIFFSRYKFVIFFYLIFILLSLAFLHVVIENNWKTKSIGNIVINSIKNVLGEPKYNILVLTAFLMIFRLSLIVKGFNLFFSISLMMLVAIFLKKLDKKK